MTSLSGMFTMLAVFAYTAGRYRFVIEKKRVSSFLFLTLAAVASVFALLSKQTAATIPVLFVLIELFFVRDINGNRRKPWALFIALATIVLYTVVISVFGLPAETTEISRLDYLATQMTVIPHYLQRMLIPIGLCIDHGVQPLNNLFDFRAVAGTLFLFALFLFAFYKSRKWPFFSFGIFWIFTTLLVESSVIPIRDVMFDHRMYLPLAGFSLSLWWLIFYLLEGKPKVAGALVIIVSLIMGAATFARNNVWSDRTAIWEEVTQKYPDHFRGWMSVGRSLAASGSSDIPKIIDSYEKALEIDPEYYQLWNDLATNYIKVGNTEKASECYQELKKSENPEHQAIAHRGLGIFSLRDNNYPTAEKHLLKTLELNPADSTALHGLSTLYFRTQQWNKVLEYSEKYLDNFSNKPDLLFNAGFAAYKTDDFEKAEVYFKQVLEKQPENVNALVYRGNALVKMQRYKKAVTFFMKAYQLTNKQEFFEVAKRLKNMGFE
jgi:tetratricopeptide (TPR) repeat protein